MLLSVASPPFLPLSGCFASEVPQCFDALEETFAPPDLSVPLATRLSSLPPASAGSFGGGFGSGATNGGNSSNFSVPCFFGKENLVLSWKAPKKHPSNQLCKLFMPS